MADFLNSTGLTQVLQAVKRAVPTTLAALSDDATHRLVTDTEKSAWNNKVSNVQADWNAASGLAQILNKPAIPTKISDLTDDVVSGNYLPLSGGEMSPSAEVSFGMPNYGYTKVSYGGISVYNGGYFDGIKVEVRDPNADGGVGGIYVTDENLYGYFKSYDYTFPKKTGIVALTSDIPSAVTESTVSGWGFTKNTGTYSKPSGGIPATDLATGVVPIGLIDNVLVGVETTIRAIDASDGIYAIGSNNSDGNDDYVLATTDQIPTESTIAGWGFTKNAGTLTGITFNGASASVSNGVAAITATMSDKELQTTKLAISNTGTYYPILSNGASTGTKPVDLNGLKYEVGSGSTFAPVTLSIGNSNSTDSRNNRQGILKLFAVGGGYTQLKRSYSVGSNVELELPASSGTLALTSQIPSVPTVNDSTITIQKNGSTVDSFTTNAASAKSINITVNELPTVTSSDNGKVLQVVNGAFALVTPVSIYSGSATPNNSQGVNGDIYIQS